MNFIRSKYRPNIEINITELCNLVCSFCPRAFDYPNENKHMTLETMELIADQIDERDTILICGRGEPTLHKNFDQLMQPLFETGAKTLLTTNGKRIDKYLETILKFDEVVLNCYYDVTFEEYEKLKDEYPDWIVDYRGDGTFEVLTLKESTPYNNRAGALGDAEIDDTDPALNYCRKPTDWLYIDWQGNYNLCCNDWEPMILGNINETPIWEFHENNEILTKYRLYLETGNRACLTPCDNCDYRANIG
jgi:MoaA/NifB/PqqE/SkfB family radical SAM enzyme